MSSPSQNRQKRQEYYQAVKGRTPNWKENFRKKCLLRVRDSRTRLVDKFRSCGSAGGGPQAANRYQMALELMEEELGGSIKKHLAGKDEDQEILMAILEEVQQEMKLYSEQLFEDIARFEKADLEQLVGKSAEVICPVCQVVALQQQPSGAIIGCKHCRFTLQGTSLSAIESSIQQTVSLHNKDCGNSLTFTPTQVPDSNAHQGAAALLLQQQQQQDEDMEVVPTPQQQMGAINVSSAAAAGGGDMSQQKSCSIGPTNSSLSYPSIYSNNTSNSSRPVLVTNVLATCSKCEWMSFLI